MLKMGVFLSGCRKLSVAVRHASDNMQNSVNEFNNVTLVTRMITAPLRHQAEERI